MKKNWLWLCLLLMLVLPMQALAVEGDAVINRNDDSISARSTFVLNNEQVVLYGYGNFEEGFGEGFGVYNIGDSDMTMYGLTYDVEELLGGEEDCSFDFSKAFEYDGKICLLGHLQKYDEDSEKLIKTVICEVELCDDQTAKIAAVNEVQWPDELLEDYGNGSMQPVYLDDCIVQNGVMYATTWGNYGMDIYAMPLDTMKPEKIDLGSQEPAMILPYSNSGLLMIINDYNASKTLCELYDPATKRVETLCEIPYEGYDNSEGFAADTETGRLYCVKDGEIREVNLQTGEVGEGLSEMPLTVYSNVAGRILGGHYYLYTSFDGTVIRNLAPEQKAEYKLKVFGDSYMDAVSDAYFDFTNTHGNVSVAIDRGGSMKDIIESMMNRSNEVDIYIMDTSSSLANYQALLERGYLAELDSSEQITASLENMYPALKEACMRNGKAVAIPVNAYCWAFGVNERALERIGLTIEDVPTNWNDFLDFLSNELPQAMENDPNVSMFYSDYTQSQVQSTLFNQVFRDYMDYAAATMDVQSYDTPLLNELLTKVENLDLAALRVPEDEERDDSIIYYVEYDDSSVLFETSVGASFNNFYSDYTPLLMGMDADAPAVLSLEINVAFVNPFSENIDLAIEYLECLQNQLDKEMLYNFYPDLTEAVRSKYYEQNVKSAQESYDETKKLYDEAEDADKQALAEQLENAEYWLEYEKKSNWDISETLIQWFRSNDDNLAISYGSWLYRDNSGEARELLQKYYEGQIDVKQLLSGIDKKVRMMEMEGM